MKGAHLTLVPHDELSFWALEEGTTRRYCPWTHTALCRKYEKATWEKEVAKFPTVIHGTKGTLAYRETIIGVAINGSAQAFPLTKLTAQLPVLLDVVGGEPIMLVPY